MKGFCQGIFGRVIFAPQARVGKLSISFNKRKSEFDAIKISVDQSKSVA
jgi:hypothetical protein